MSKPVVKDSMKSNGYSQEEVYFHKENLEKIEVIRASQKKRGGGGKVAADAQEGGGVVIPFPARNVPQKKAA